MAQQFDRVRIITALLNKVADPLARLYQLSYDPVTKLPSVNTAAKVSPSSVHVDEVKKDFVPAVRNRQHLVLDTAGWLFQLKMAFPCTVALELFERDLKEQPIQLPRDVANGLPHQITLLLKPGTVYKHPVQSEGAGTEVSYNIEAQLSPL